MSTSPQLLERPRVAGTSPAGGAGGFARAGGWMLRERSIAVRYGVAILCVLAAWLAHGLTSPALDDNLRLGWFSLAVVAAASLGGWGPGLAATGLLAISDAVAGAWPARHAPAGMEEVAWRLACVVIGVSISAAGHAMRSAHRRLEAEERTAQESERCFVGLFDQTALGICLASADGRILAANRKLHQMLGYEEDDLRQRSFEQLTFAEDWPAILVQHLRLRAHEIDNYSIEKRSVRRDGSLLWAQFTCSAIRGDQERVVAIIEDISDRKEAEEALRESEEKFRTLAEHAHVCIGIMQGTRIIYANPFFAKVTGYTVDEIQGMDFPRMVHPSSREMMLERGMRRYAGEQVVDRYEFVCLTKSGESRWVDFSPALFQYHGKPAIIGTGFDVTERKATEAALRESEARLAEAKEAAEAANRAKDHFLAVLSHELRTPLTPVLAAATILSSDDRLPPGAMEDLEMIRRNVELEARLIDDLLDMTRIARGKIELDRRPVAICEILRRTTEVCLPDIEARGLHFGVTIDKPPHLVDADAARLQQVFWNLIKNAVKFTPHGGCVGVHCWPEDGQVVVEVSDSGEGIEPEALGRIFSAFEQAERAVTRRFGGLGLGLSICKALVELHGGSIEARSEGKGKGAAFRVRLPLVVGTGEASPLPQERAGRAPPLQEEWARHAPPLQEGRAGRAPPLRILLVEDHGDTARMMRQLLILDGHSVEHAGDVATALDMAGQQDFDLLLSDLGLPDGTGLDLMRGLRARGWTVPGIALSGYGMEQDIQRSRDAGFAVHLTKPINPRQLGEALERAVGRSD